MRTMQKLLTSLATGSGRPRPQSIRDLMDIVCGFRLEHELLCLHMTADFPSYAGLVRRLWLHSRADSIARFGDMGCSAGFHYS